MNYNKTSKISLISISIITIILLTLKNQYDKKVYIKPKTTDSIYLAGEKLVSKNCISCHHRGMKDKMTAPPLGNITKRRNKKWLFSYIRNSIKMYEQGDKIAINLRKEGWGLMPSFEYLSDKQLETILHFIEKRYEKTLKGVPIPYYFEFNEKDNKNAVACIHVLNENKTILNSSRPNKDTWIFSFEKKHLKTEWKKTTIRNLFNKDSTINELVLLNYYDDDRIFINTATRKDIKSEWIFKENK